MNKKSGGRKWSVHQSCFNLLCDTHSYPWARALAVPCVPGQTHGRRGRSTLVISVLQGHSLLRAVPGAFAPPLSCPKIKTSHGFEGPIGQNHPLSSELSKDQSTKKSPAWAFSRQMLCSAFTKGYSKCCVLILIKMHNHGNIEAGKDLSDCQVQLLTQRFLSPVMATCLNKGEHWNTKNPWLIKPQNTKETNKSVELR